MNMAEVEKPHEMINQIHPNVIIQYMRLRSDMGELLALYKLYWKHVEGGIVQRKFKLYCNILFNAFNILFDLYFSDADKFNEAKAILIHLHNEKYPDERVDSLVWNAESTFEIHVQSNPEEGYSSEELKMSRPHDRIRRFHPLALIEYMKSQDDMEELLVLYYLYWRHEHENIQSCTDGLEDYCYLLLNAYNILFDTYYSGTKDIEKAILVLKNIENEILAKQTKTKTEKLKTEVVNLFLQFCYSAGI
ncbi:uncharacterized protein LOC126836619 isoform X2 [Adelges cooleyi]|nr:uncharacterized protein LOC126836619 isoform X2 [Adelges cooleyi]